jgi:serine phosphatase RsbU (regulator of sigma subunit)
MYATFTGLRLCEDGRVFFALAAASPPLLQWHASRATLSNMEEQQFPLGLLPVAGFDGHTLQAKAGDLLVVATDGILEVANKPGEEFGVERLKEAIASNSTVSLPDLAQKILSGASGFGAQFDDQTILLVRCL